MIRKRFPTVTSHWHIAPLHHNGELLGYNVQREQGGEIEVVAAPVSAPGHTEQALTYAQNVLAMIRNTFTLEDARAVLYPKTHVETWSI